MKLDDVIILYPNKLISVFREKEYIIKDISDVYNFINLNVGSKRKILLIRNNMTIPDLTNFNFNFSIGSISENYLNVVKFSLDSIIFNFSRINNKISPDTRVQKISNLTKKNTSNIKLSEYKKLIKSNEEFKLLIKCLNDESVPELVVSNKFITLKNSFNEKKKKLISSNKAINNSLNNQLISLDAQYRRFIVKSYVPRDFTQRKKLLENNIKKNEETFINEMKLLLDEFSRNLDDYDLYILENKIEIERGKKEEIARKEELKRQTELKKQQKAERLAKLREKAEREKQAEIKKLEEKKASMIKRQEELKRIAEIKRQAELKKQEEEEAKRQAELKKQQEEEAKRQAELKKQQEEARRQAELKKQQEEEAENKNTNNQLKYQFELQRQLSIKKQLELNRISKIKKAASEKQFKINNIIMEKINNCCYVIVDDDNMINKFKENNTKVSLNFKFIKKVDKDQCINIYENQRNDDDDRFHSVDDVVYLKTTIIALMNGIKSNNVYHMIVDGDTILDEEFMDKFNKLEIKNDFNVLRLTSDDNNDCVECGKDCVDTRAIIYNMDYVKRKLLNFCNKFVGNLNATLNNVPKSYVVGGGLLNLNENINKFVMIITSYNNSKWYIKNLDSVVNQTFKNWRIIYVDDCSTDDTYELVKEFIKNKNIENRVTLIRNESNMKQAYSRYIAFKECDDDEICCLLDGDDWLYDNNVLSKLNKVYNMNDCMVTYSDFIRYHQGELGQIVRSQDYNDDIKKNSMYRNSAWLCTPLRTAYAKLFKNIMEEEMKDHNGDWLKCSTDMAIMYNVMEQSKGKIKVINDVMYVYNIDNSMNYDSSYYNKNLEFNKYREQVNKLLKNKIFKLDKNILKLNKKKLLYMYDDKRNLDFILHNNNYLKKFNIFIDIYGFNIKQNTYSNIKTISEIKYLNEYLYIFDKDNKLLLNNSFKNIKNFIFYNKIIDNYIISVNKLAFLKIDFYDFNNENLYMINNLSKHVDMLVIFINTDKINGYNLKNKILLNDKIFCLTYLDLCENINSFKILLSIKTLNYYILNKHNLQNYSKDYFFDKNGINIKNLSPLEISFINYNFKCIKELILYSDADIIKYFKNKFNNHINTDIDISNDTEILPNYFSNEKNELNKICNNVYCLNLPNRVDRRYKFDNNAKKINLNFEYIIPESIEIDELENINKIKIYILNPIKYSCEFSNQLFTVKRAFDYFYKNNFYISKGAYSYLKSYINLLKKSLNKSNICIFDDDTTFIKNFNAKFRLCYSKNIKFLKLGTLDYNWKKNIKDSFTYNCDGESYATHACLINNEIIKILLNLLESTFLPVDIYGTQIIFKILKDESKICYPNLCIQQISTSDINSSKVQKELTIKKSYEAYGWNLIDYDISENLKIGLIGYPYKQKGLWKDYEVLENILKKKDFIVNKFNVYVSCLIKFNNNNKKINDIKFEKNNLEEFINYNDWFYMVEVYSEKLIKYILNLGKNFYFIPNPDCLEINVNNIPAEISQHKNFFVLNRTKYSAELFKNFKNNYYIGWTLLDNSLGKINTSHFKKLDNLYFCNLGNGGTNERRNGSLILETFNKYFNNNQTNSKLIIKSNFKINKKYNKNIIIIDTFIDYKELEELYLKCTYFINIPKFEGLGLTILEGMKFGCTQFLTNGSPMNELLPIDLCIYVKTKNKFKWNNAYSYEIDENDFYKKIIRSDNVNLTINKKNIVNYYKNKKSFILINNYDLKLKKHYKYIINITTFRRSDYLIHCLENLNNIIDNTNEYLIYISSNDNFKINFNSNLNIIYKNNNIKGAAYQKSEFINFLKKTNLSYDMIFMMDDDLIMKKNVFNFYYNNSDKYKHLCYINNYQYLQSLKKNKIEEKIDNKYKYLNSVEHAQGCFFTVTKEIIDKVGFFDYFSFPVRSDFHEDFSRRCCRLGFNNYNKFYDLKNSEKFIELIKNNYKMSLKWEDYSFIKKSHEIERRNLVKNNKERIYIPFKNYDVSLILSTKQKYYLKKKLSKDINIIIKDNINDFEFITETFSKNNKNILYVLFLQEINPSLEKEIIDFKNKIKNFRLNTKLLILLYNYNKKCEFNFEDNIFIIVKKIKNIEDFEEKLLIL